MTEKTFRLIISEISGILAPLPEYYSRLRNSFHKMFLHRQIQVAPSALHSFRCSSSHYTDFNRSGKTILPTFTRFSHSFKEQQDIYSTTTLNILPAFLGNLVIQQFVSCCSQNVLIICLSFIYRCFVVCESADF